MRAPEFITGHVTFKLGYNHIYQLKTHLLRMSQIIVDEWFTVRLTETNFSILSWAPKKVKKNIS